MKDLVPSIVHVRALVLCISITGHAICLQRLCMIAPIRFRIPDVFWRQSETDISASLTRQGESRRRALKNAACTEHTIQALPCVAYVASKLPCCTVRNHCAQPKRIGVSLSRLVTSKYRWRRLKISSSCRLIQSRENSDVKRHTRRTILRGINAIVQNLCVLTPE